MTATLAPTKDHRFYSSALAGAKWPVERQPDGTAIVRGIEIFKTGEFRDSMGEKNLWEDIHLQQMVANWSLLASNNIFPEPPMRVGHWTGMQGVCGYLVNLYVNDAGRLAMDIHVTEPNDVDKIDRGTYRFVSSEIGMYETNDGSAYWPTVFGVAFTDIPAVEGLHGKQQDVHCFSRVDQNAQESTVAENQTQTKDGEQEMVAPPAAHGTPNQAAPAAAPAAAPQAFSLFGKQTTDPVAVQTHINSLEATVDATDKAQREDFVKGLEKAKVIAATQTTKMTEFAKGLTPEAFESWKDTFADAPQITLLQEHGQTAPGQPGGEKSDKEKEIEVCKQTLAYTKRAVPNISAEKLAKHPAAVRLAELTNQN